ncbi:hypothetical protein [Vreelandella titanicae]|uniref:hypothetical protein n=1 Tax=Vreelandella titanicae TaxID=664683 RepID=UPI003FD8D708
MSQLMQQIDTCIYTTINRLSGESGSMESKFYIDLFAAHPDRKRITEKLVEESISLCRSRGIGAEVSGDGLMVTINLYSCYLSPEQAKLFNTALDYTRTMHGNHV